MPPVPSHLLLPTNSCPAVLPVLSFPPFLLHKVFNAPSLDSGTKLKSHVPFPSAHLCHIPAVLTLPWGTPLRSSKSTKHCQSLPPSFLATDTTVSATVSTLPYLATSCYWGTGCHGEFLVHPTLTQRSPPSIHATLQLAPHLPSAHCDSLSHSSSFSQCILLLLLFILSN